MNVVRTLWGLLVDDPRLVSILMIAFVMAAVVSYFGHLPSIAAFLIWLGLIVSLTVSVEHQLQLKTKGKHRSK